MDNSIVISTPPHVKTSRTTKKIMLDVAIALIPSAIAGIVFFGLYALVLELLGVISCVAFEYIYFFIANGGFAEKCKNAKAVSCKWYKQFDYTSVVTGLILALILPTTCEWYQIILGSAFAIVLVKMLYGGTGKNLVNPAAAGRVFMFISFSAIMSVSLCNISPLSSSSTILTGASYLSGSLLSNGSQTFALVDLFLGTGVAGCIGETCKLAILLGYIYLVVRKVIKWWQPALMIAVVFVLSLFINSFNLNTAISLTLSGGVFFGAVFMITDYVTSPKGDLGQIVFIVFIGIMTAALRAATGLEVLSFVILLGNIVTPLIDRHIIAKPFGYVKPPKAKKEAK